MKKKVLSFITILLLCITVTACSSKQRAVDPANLDTSLVGTWAEDYFDSGYIFNDDGTGTDTFWDLPFTYTAKDGSIHIVYDDEMWGATTYAYSVDGDTLFMTQSGSEDTYEYLRQ